MTLLSTVQSAAPWIGIAVPDQVFSATTREMVEMQQVAKEAARRICEAHDWTKLRTIATITGDGSTTAFDLPSDFARMMKTTELRSSVNTAVPLTHITDADEWLQLEVTGITFPYGAWIDYGGQVNIKPARAASETVKYFYISDACVAPADGSNKTTFTADDDTFRLSEDLLKLAIVWMWKAQKLMDYQEDFVTYETALARAIGYDKGPSMFAVGTRVKDPYASGVAYPFALGS